jgi:hypothetical protein
MSDESFWNMLIERRASFWRLQHYFLTIGTADDNTERNNIPIENNSSCRRATWDLAGLVCRQMMVCGVGGIAYFSA